MEVSPVLSVLLDGHGVSGVGSRSDGSGSPVEDEPLLDVVRVVVLDSESVLVGTNVLSDEQGSVGAHSRFDLELETVSEWVSWEMDSGSVEHPSLVGTVGA